MQSLTGGVVYLLFFTLETLMDTSGSPIACSLDLYTTLVGCLAQHGPMHSPVMPIGPIGPGGPGITSLLTASFSTYLISLKR